MTEANYSPYCGNATGTCSMPRTTWNGNQFECHECGWVSSFPNEFISDYKNKWKKSNNQHR